MKRLTLLFVFIAILFASIGAYFGLKKFTPAQPTNAAVAALMASTLPDAKNQSHALTEWQGKTLLVNFWATWCPPCVAEMPELDALQTEMAAKNLQIIGIGIDSPSNIQEFASKYKISYPLLIAGMNGTELARQFGNAGGGLPFTVLISPNGEIKKTYLGRLDMSIVREDLQKQ